VVDFTENMAGPFGTMILADQGADVIKIESPAGDMLRRQGSGSSEMSAYFANLNRSKRSLALDLHVPESRDVLNLLLDSADVVTQSFRPSAAKRLGIDANSVTRGRPRLIHASIVGFGVSGSLTERPVYDHVIQALSGMADLQRESPEDSPHMIRHGLVDKSTGYVFAQSICAALIERFRSDVGNVLEINMLDVAVSFLWPDAMMDRSALQPELRKPAVALTFRLTRTNDGYVSLVVVKQAHWDGLVAALNLDANVQNFQASAAGTALPGNVLRAARAAIEGLSTEEVVQRLSKFDVPCAPVLTLDEMVEHPQIVENGTLMEYDHPIIGPIRQPRPTPRFASAQNAELRPAPGLGDDSREVLRELGVKPVAIDQLVACGAVIERTS
jgi:crotonobetainyl-CoA:carnitine CoA-transferase CaiB-like acyl-CoA transferase